MRLDLMLAMCKMKSNELAEAISLSEQNLRALSCGKTRAGRFYALNASCGLLDCQPGNLMEFVEELQENRLAC